MTARSVYDSSACMNYIKNIMYQTFEKFNKKYFQHRPNASNPKQACPFQRNGEKLQPGFRIDARFSVGFLESKDLIGQKVHRISINLKTNISRIR